MYVIHKRYGEKIFRPFSAAVPSVSETKTAMAGRAISVEEELAPSTNNYFPIYFNQNVT